MECPNCLGPIGPDCDEPEKMKDQPMGMFHCGWCSVMQLAGTSHMNCEVCNGTGKIDGRSKLGKTIKKRNQILR